MEKYTEDVRKYATNVNEDAISAIVKYCGIALRNADSALVSATSTTELATVRDGFAARKLGLSAEQADAAMKKVIEKMKATPRKSRVTFYYLLAEESGTLDKLA